MRKNLDIEYGEGDDEIDEIDEFDSINQYDDKNFYKESKIDTLSIPKDMNLLSK